MQEIQPGISPDDIDREVLKVIAQFPGITKASIYYQLQNIPQTLLYSSIKRLELNETLGYCLTHSPIQENKTEEIHSPIHSPTQEEIHSPIQENKGLHIRWRPSAGTATGDYLYPYLYSGDRCVMYIGGGNKTSSIALKRVEEIQGLIDREILQPTMTDEAIRHLTVGVKRRNY